MNHFKYHLTIGLLLLAIGVGMIFYESRDPVTADTFDTEAGVTNASPVINQTPADDSDTTTPTNAGDDVTFTGKGIDVGSENYYMAFCSSDQVTHNGASAPTCEDADHTWAISSSTASNTAIGSGSGITYTTTGSESSETNDCTDDESCPWYAFVCDAVAGGSCYPANSSGDQGSALGTITFSDVPEDGDYITINSVIYEFDTGDDGVTGGRTEVDTAASASKEDAAYELVAVEAGASSHMAVRGAVVYVYADTEGTAGNSIGITEPDANEGGSSNEITLSGTTLSGGDATGQSPFKINHAPTFVAVSVTDVDGGDIQPGDILRFTLANADIDDTDSDGTQDTISMYICTDATTGYSGGCTDGALICSDTGVDPTSEDATCDETGNNLVPPTDTGGTENFKVYVFDSHGLAGTGTNQQSYTITNTAPTQGDPILKQHAPILPNSVAYWQFEDGDSATSFDDETSNDNDASCTNCPDWDEDGGVVGGAYDFNGTDDYIVSDWSNFILSEHTISFWMKANSINTSWHDLIGTQLNSDQNRFHLQSGDNSIVWYYPLGATSVLDSNVIPVAGDWYHVVGTHDGTTARIYVNGDLKNSVVAGTSITSTGVWIGGTTEPFDGFIDEVHIYDRALTAYEIASLYNDTSTADADLVSEYTFNDGPDGFTQALNINVEGNWDTTRAMTPNVIKDGDTYKMWYTGYDGANYRILYTTSTNGTTWTTPVQALDKNQEGSWDINHVYHPTVIKDGSTYKMWFSGTTGTYSRILYSTSTNGTTWTTPVQALNYNLEGSWDTYNVSNPTVLKDGNTYKMWVVGNNSSYGRILYTTSTNGTTWTTPIKALDKGQEGSWDTAHAHSPVVIKDGNTYKMWYSGSDGTNYRIVYTKINYMDEAGGNDGTAVDGVPIEVAAGKVGNAIDLNGSSEYVQVPDSASVGGQAAATVSLWFKTDTFDSSGYNGLYYESTSTSGYSRLSMFHLEPPDGRLVAYARDSNTGSSFAIYSDAAVSTGEWHHVLATYDSSTNNFVLYLDGVEQESNTDAKGAFTSDTPGDPIGIGCFTHPSAPAYHDGMIDEVRIYDSALSASEVLGLYNSYITDSNMDISVYPGAISDHDSDSTTVIYNWEKDGSSITTLNMPFDSNITSTTTDAIWDYSGNMNYGTLGGDQDEAPTWTSSCIKGGCYDFNGSDELIQVEASTSLNTVDELSLETWFNIDNTSTGQDVDAIIIKYAWGSGFGGFGFGIGYQAGGYTYDAPAFGLIESYAINDVQMSSMPSLDTWHHMVGTYDGTTIKLYVDGELEDSATTSFGTIDSTGDDLYIGGQKYYTRWFDGMIDEVRMYDYALSAQQVAQNYNNGKPLYNTIVNQELSESDTSWECEVTINDAQSDYADSGVAYSNIILPGNSEPVQNIPSARAHALVDSDSVGYWRLEYGEYTNQSFDDETTNGNDGECDTEASCPAFTPEGAIGGAYDFDGTDDFIYTNDSASLSVTGDLAISAWVKPDTVDNEQTIVSKWEESTGVDDRSYRLWIDSSNNLNFSVSTDGSAVVSHTGTDTALSSDTWYHVTGVYDNAGTMDVYVDGSVDAEQKSSGVPASIDDNASALAIGIKADTSGDPDTFFDGIIDEVHIYDRALSATEVENLYNSTSYVYTSNDLGVSALDMSDADDDSLYATVDWRESDTSIAVLNMSFNEEVSSIDTGAVNDYSTYGNDFTLGGGSADYAPTWTDAATCGNNSGGCYDFDGTDNYMLDYDSASLSVTGDLTVEAWVKLGTASAEQTILGKWDETTANNDRSYRLWVDSSNNINFSVSTDGSAVVSHTGTTTTFGTTNWYHVVGVYDNAGTMDVYVNGSGDASQKTSGVPSSIDDNASNLYIAGKENASGNLDTILDGYIDEVRIYNRALTADQVAVNYNAGNPNYQNIAYGETVIGEVWSAQMTIAEGNSEESTTIESNGLEILGFSTAPYEDPASTSTAPTDEDDDVTFKATANVEGTSQWYLAVCKTDAVTAGDDAAPTCDDGAWDVSDATDDETLATATYTTDGSEAESEDWYAFACDKIASTATCSPYSQGSGDSGSPFKVNHRPVIGTVNIGDTTGGTGDIEAGDDVFFNVAVTDGDTDGSADTIDMHVCLTNSFTEGVGCASEQTICKTLANAPGTLECDSGDTTGDLTSTYNDTGTSGGQKTVYIFLEDSHDLRDAGTDNLQNYTLTNSAPAFTAGPTDSSSSNSTPTNAGLNVTFTATATDDNEDDYYLLVCKTGDAPTTGAPPECNGGSGNRWALSSATTSGDPVSSVTYTTSPSDVQQNTWYAFVCDAENCSSAAQGSGDNGTPFEVNHRPVIGTVTIGPSYGSSASVDPGNDTTGVVYFQVGVTDADSAGTADTMSIWACPTDAFTPGVGCDDTFLCWNSGAASGGNAQCGDVNLAPIPTTHGTKTVYIFIVDNHDFQDGDSTHNQTYDVTDVAPVVISYSMTDTLDPAAGGYDTYAYTAVVSDNNGDADIEGVEGYFYDDTAIDLSSGQCSEDENDCYKDQDDCSLNTSYGTNIQVEATCSMNVWFNANASTGWKGHVNVEDETTTVTDGSDSAGQTNPELQGITVAEAGIAYGTLALDTTSVGRETSMGNMGNQVIDVLVDGDDMCIDSYSATCPSSYIPLTEQKWHHTSDTFRWADSETGAGPWILEDTSGTGGDGDGCLNRNIQVRDGHSETTTDESIYWKLHIPVSQAIGDYVGQNTFSTTADDTCTGTQYD